MVYKGANFHKIWSYGSNCSKGPNMAMQPRFQTTVSAEFCLTLSQVRKDTRILGVSLCMSIRGYYNVFKAPWSTPHPKLSSGGFTIAVTTRLIEHSLIKSSLTYNFWNNSKSVKIWSVNYEKCPKFYFLPPQIFLDFFLIPSYLF
jgi:hypothetical protein